MPCFVAMISEIKMASFWFDVSLSFLSTSGRCSRNQSPSFCRLVSDVSPMGYNYFAYGVKLFRLWGITISPMGYNYFAYGVLHIMAYK